VPAEASGGLAGRDAAALALLRLANRAPSRAELAREAAKLILDATRADELRLWLEDGGQLLVWSGQRAAAKVAFEPMHSDTVGRPLVEGVVRLFDGSEQLAAAAHRTARGSVWISFVDSRPRPSVALVPFEIDERNQGVLQIESSTPGFFAVPDVVALEALAELLGVAIANRRGRSALAERIKELDCMYRIAQLGAEAELGLDSMLQKIVDLLPPAWQYPELATARITLDDSVFRSPEFCEGPHRLSADISVWGEPRGRVEVFYVARGGRGDDEPLLEETPFLEEERHLMAGVARELASIIERKQSEAEKARLRDQLRHADRLATIGELAAGVAHELNEPLGNILGFAQLARKSSELPAAVSNDLDRIVAASLYSREVPARKPVRESRTGGGASGDAKLARGAWRSRPAAASAGQPRSERNPVDAPRRPADGHDGGE
jgi:GAF domain-containing protein